MKKVIRKRHVLEPLMTQLEAAGKMGVSRGRISQLERSAFAKIKLALESNPETKEKVVNSHG